MTASDMFEALTFVDGVIMTVSLVWASVVYKRWIGPRLFPDLYKQKRGKP